MHKIIRLMLIAAALIGAGTADAADRIKVAKPQGNVWTFLPLEVGIEQKLFAQQGIEIETADMGGDARVQQALAAGSVEFGIGSGPGMAFAAKGAPAISVAAFGGPPLNIGAIVLDNSP